MLLIFVKRLLDPDASISVNGVPTKQWEVKLAATAFVSVFPVMGFVFVVVPKANMERLIGTFNRWAKAWRGR